MKSPASPHDSRQPRSGYAADEADWYISPSTRQRAQEADASITQQDNRYTPRDPAEPDLPVAERHYFLP